MIDKKIGIIGVGRLGLAYALAFEKAGYQVMASSYKKQYVKDLQQRKVNTVEPGIKELLSHSKNIIFTHDNHQVIDHCDVIYVMVATPSTQHGDYDVSAIEQVANDFLSHEASVENKILLIGSTVNPGITEKIQQMLSHKQISVAYCPTFVAQGSVLQNIFDPHTLSIGTDDENIFEICRDIFLSITSNETPIYRLSPLSGEILKLAGNCRHTMEISYFNMIGQILLSQGLERDIDAANQYLNFVKKDARWSFGFGYGGPCFPRDNRAFAYFAAKNNIDYPLGSIIDQFNRDHVEFLANYLHESNPDGLPFYFEYVSYKSGVNMLEESHPLKVCKKLLERGAQVQIKISDFLPADIIDEFPQELQHQISFVHDYAGPDAAFKINF